MEFSLYYVLFLSCPYEESDKGLFRLILDNDAHFFELVHRFRYKSFTTISR